MALKLMHNRMGNYEKPHYYSSDKEIENIDTMN
jgi:hypothetical protein